MKFSFVIPCYKSEESITQCLGSIFDQDFKDFEVVCVLDGENDVLESLIRVFPKAKVIKKEHSGVIATRNCGLNAITGDFVIFSDSDMYWKPGILRKFAETLDKTGADFAYGGYRFVNFQGGHVPMDFDPYLFTVFNYVDGANPLRTSIAKKIGGWREGVKRFQDWDMWIRAIKEGAVGVNIKEIAKDTDYPEKDSISAQDNYKEWYFKVRELNQLDDRRVCVTSIAAPQHALRIAKLCGWDYWPNPSTLPKDYDAIYLLGCFTESIDDHVRMFMKFGGGRRDCKYLIHWIGTDVFHLMLKHPYLNVRQIRNMFEKYGVKHYVQSRENGAEMEEMGFDVELTPLPVELDTETPPLAKDFTVAVYDHGGVDEKWHKWLVMELAKCMPDVKFLFYGNKNAVGVAKNTEWVGHKPIKEIIKQSHCLLRLTVHDGFPVSVVEFLYAGRKVITNVKDLPYTELVKLGEVREDRVIEIKKLVHDAIRKVKMSPFIASHDEIVKTYNEILNPENFKRKIEYEINKSKCLPTCS